MKRIFTIVMIIASIGNTLSAQELRYKVEAVGTVASEKTPPTWHLSNRQGLSGDIALRTAIDVKSVGHL